MEQQKNLSPKIHQLPDHIIAQIAAGEVIERPAYAVKELLENAIDAKADDIQIYLEDGGIKKIMVIDNGWGMEPNDLRNSYKHHTTSKLYDSLVGVRSFGFRGEALSSIASVSTMIIKSKTATDESGTMVEIRNSVPIRETAVGMPKGTTIIINDLFRTVPVRKKFLKSQRTEVRHCLEIVLQTAIAYPHIKIQLFHNSRTMLDFPKTKQISDRLRYLFGTDITNHMIPISYTESYISIHGFISSPHIITANTAKQYLYINNRHVSDTGISQAIKEGYGRLLETTSQPLFVIFLTIPPELVDVNVHPRKEQIALINKEAIHNHISNAITKAIENHQLNYTPTLANKKRTTMPAHASSLLRQIVMPKEKAAYTIDTTKCFTIDNLYLVVQTTHGLLIIDQHAAHERILYEKYTQAFLQQTQKKAQIALKESLILDIGLQAKELLTQHQLYLNDIGFIYEEFGSEKIKLTHIPELFKDHDLNLLFTEIISQLQMDRTSPVDTQSQKMLAYLACRSAIKAGDELSSSEITELIETLEKTENNYTCPHGRPTKTELPLSQLHKLFKRT